MNKILKVKCPQCATEFSYYESEFRPFCTERCKQIDLGHWFQESYVVPSKEVVDEVESENQIENQNEEHNKSDYE